MSYQFQVAGQEEWDWFQFRTHVIRCEDSRALAMYREVEEGFKLVAMAVCDSFTKDNGCSVHFCIEDPIVLRHGFLEEIARYVFIERDCRRIFGLVPSNNEKALKLDAHIGFTELARIPNGVAEGVDTVVLGMERDECRWLPSEEEAA